MSESKTASDRKTAGEALKLAPNVDAFIRRGVPGKNELSRASRAEDVGPDVSESGPANSSGDVSRDKPRRRRSSGRKSRAEKETAASDREDLLRTLARATVQKTVRFQPQLIAEFDALVRTEVAAGRKPKSFQEVQNEALKLWLKRRGS